MRKIVTWALCLLGMAATAKNFVLTSPNGEVVVNLNDEGGKLVYNVSYQGVQLLEDSPLGIVTDRLDFTKGVSIENSTEPQTLEKAYELRTIKQRNVRVAYRQAVLTVAGEGGKMVFLLDEKPLSDTIAVSKANAIPSEEENDDIYNDYFKVKTNVTLPAGKHILRMVVAQQYFDVDYFTLVKGANATDPEPIEETQSFANDIHMTPNTLQDYFVFDAHGVNLGIISGYGFDAAAEMLKSTSDIRNSGIYYLRNRTTGKMQAVRIAK